MEDIGHQTAISKTPTPCEYFDLIGGTGTGGLVAIMLGLLGMVHSCKSTLINPQTIDECIDSSLKLSKEVFNVDQVLLGTIPVGDDKCRFDYTVLENVIKSIVKDRLGSCSYDMSEVSNSPYPYCPTFVVAKKALHMDGPPTVFRSYGGEGIRPSKCLIWQAARATSATPTFFKEMYIDNPRPGINYVDGGFGHNNPAQVALDEAGRVWPIGKQFCLVSLGTGRQKAIKITCSSSEQVDDLSTQRSVFERIKTFFPQIVSSVPGWKTANNFPLGVLALIKMASALSSLVTNSEEVHQRLQRASRTTDVSRQFPYFRFNVERDMGDIGLGDWKRKEEIAVYTTAYLEEQEAEEKKLLCVKCLISKGYSDELPSLSQKENMSSSSEPHPQSASRSTIQQNSKRFRSRVPGTKGLNNMGFHN